MSKEENQDLIENEEIDEEVDEEDYEGRDWGKLFLGIAFIFVVVIIWYVIQALT
ncbi:MAG: hypothetical protein KAS63_00590 [Candidatus Heimdallarchaeota archaeon]|nr:hypothetical protein [Candidatus Heimdallarchaeota archaeon]MCK4953840.1 hypothetical protein [Candidatus Heimdallarchaeota archaeon]